MYFDGSYIRIQGYVGLKVGITTTSNEKCEFDSLANEPKAFY